jgi:hypothetical protein
VESANSIPLRGLAALSIRIDTDIGVSNMIRDFGFPETLSGDGRYPLQTNVL